MKNYRKALLSSACLTLLLVTPALQARKQIGAGNLELSLDGTTVENGYGSETGTTVKPGSTLTGNVQVNGVTGNGGTTTVTCDDAQGQFFSWSTSTSGSSPVTYKAPASGTDAVYCSAHYAGNYANGTVTTGTLYVPTH